MRRVVVTGIGLVTPLAGDVSHTWERLLAGKSGIRKIEKFDVSDLPAKIAGQVNWGQEAGEFNPDLCMDKREQRRVDTFIIYGMHAAMQAIEDSGWKPQTEEELCRTGVTIGSGIGGLPSIERDSILVHEKGPRKLSPFFIPGSLINLVAGQVSIKYGFKGPNHAVVTACSTGAHSIGDASRFIQYGDADVMIAGGAECALCRVGIGGFAAARALSVGYNDTPELASRPWDKGRDGFVMGEGAGIVVLEEYEHAKKRGAKIYAEVGGYGLSGDAHHITTPPDDGNGGYRSMKMALGHAGVNPDQVDYVNAHGTSTPVGDMIELSAVKRLFANSLDRVSMSSTKSSIGHLLGAAGGVEAIFAILSVKDNIVPPTLNLQDPDENCQGVDLVPLNAKEKQVDVAISNSFGFGGTNASVLFKKI